MRWLALTVAIAALNGCESDLIYIDRFTPFDGPSISSISEVADTDPNDILAERNTITTGVIDASENPSVDSFINLCLQGSTCEAEPFTAHFAWVRVRNDQPMIDGVPAAIETITSYRVEFREVTGGPTLAPFEAGVRAVIGPGETTTFQITLVPFEYKRIIDNVLSAGDPALTYRAQITLTGQQDLSLQASTTVLIGPFNNCPDGVPISPDEQTFFCTEG
ncbi:MAG: hypothetical protein AAF654_05610 [Myxococcota bacterium]